MKKHDMKSKLRTKMSDVLHETVVYADACDIMDFLLKEGMLPPKNPNLTMSMFLNIKDLHQWEPEDVLLTDDGQKMDGN